MEHTAMPPVGAENLRVNLFPSNFSPDGRSRSMDNGGDRSRPPAQDLQAWDHDCDRDLASHNGAHRDGNAQKRHDGLDDAEHRVQQIIQEAEALRARMLDTQGINISNLNRREDNLQLDHLNLGFNDQMVHSVVVDQNYFMVAAHVDDTTHRRIVNGEYIDFARLLPCDHLNSVDDHRMELVNYNGHAFYVPAADRDSNGITSFNRWELAFRVFTDIYLRHHPTRASELIQYNHIIQVASMAFQWDNVYRYDREFHLHLSHNPGRSWAIILQQAWSVTLKDKHTNQQNERSKCKDICYRYNRG